PTPIPKRRTVRMKRSRRISFAAKRLRQGMILVLRMSKKDGSSRQRMEGSVDKKLSIGRLSLRGLMIKLVKKEALLPKLIQKGSHLLSLDLHSEQEALHRFKGNEEYVLAARKAE